MCRINSRSVVSCGTNRRSGSCGTDSRSVSCGTDSRSVSYGTNRWSVSCGTNRPSVRCRINSRSISCGTVWVSSVQSATEDCPYYADGAGEGGGRCVYVGGGGGGFTLSGAWWPDGGDSEWWRQPVLPSPQCCRHVTAGPRLVWHLAVPADCAVPHFTCWPQRRLYTGGAACRCCWCACGGGWPAESVTLGAGCSPWLPPDSSRPLNGPSLDTAPPRRAASLSPTPVNPVAVLGTDTTRCGTSSVHPTRC